MSHQVTSAFLDVPSLHIQDSELCSSMSLMEGMRAEVPQHTEPLFVSLLNRKNQKSARRSLLEQSTVPPAESSGMEL